MMDDHIMNMDPDHAQMHLKYKGWKLVILGLLILINFAWINWDWWVFVGVIFVLAGILKLTGKSVCPSCMPGTQTKKKRKR